MASISADKRDLYKIIDGKNEHSWTVENLCRTIHSLKQRGYIEIAEKNGGVSICYTERATFKMLESISNKIKKTKHFTFVSFDIPESMKTNRNLFRSALKRLGFVKLQGSLWVNNKNVIKYVELSAKEYKVDKYIIYIINGDTNITNFISRLLN